MNFKQRTSQVITALSFALILMPAAINGACAQDAPVPGAQSLPTDEGPLQEERQALLSKILQARSQGVGIGSYMTEFKKVQDTLRNNPDPAAKQAAQDRIKSLTSSLQEQLHRRNVIKTQVPSMYSTRAGLDSPAAPATPAVQAAKAADAATEKGAAAAAPDNSTMLDKIKEKIGGDIPPGLQDKLMKDDRTRSIIEKLSQ